MKEEHFYNGPVLIRLACHLILAPELNILVIYQKVPDGLLNS